MDHVDQTDHCLLQMPQKEANSTYTRDISLNIRHCRNGGNSLEFWQERERGKKIPFSFYWFLSWDKKRNLWEIFLLHTSLSSLCFSLLILFLFLLRTLPSLFPFVSQHTQTKKIISFLVFLNVLRKAYHRQNNQLSLLFLSYFFCFITISFHDFQTLA